MAHRRDHYEDAFEDYLRGRGWPYIAVDEAKRKTFAEARIKNFDFLVYSSHSANLLVDIKGRKFPDLSASVRRRVGRPWENWITREDVEGLDQWQTVFGAGFCAAIVFAYWIQGSPKNAPFDEMHIYRGRPYFFAVITLDEYRASARPRSAKWQTLTMPTAEFRRLVRPLEEML